MARTPSAPRIKDPAVRDAFAAYPPAPRRRLRELRALLYATAAETHGVGALEETLRWGEPAYLTRGSGTTVRLHWQPRLESQCGQCGQCGMYVPCQTSLVAEFRAHYGDALSYEGKRAVLLPVTDAYDRDAVAHCMALALTYHQRKRAQRKAARTATQ